MSNNHILAALCLSAIATASPATADCSRPRTSQSALKHADVVFRGTVRELKTAGELSWTYAPFPRAAAVWNTWIMTLDVSRVWKGPVTAIRLARGRLSTPVRFPFEQVTRVA